MNRIAIAVIVFALSIGAFAQRFVKIGVTTNELVTMNPLDLNNVVLVRGYGSTNTSDGALFQFISGDTRAANGVDVFAPTNSALGRWIMVRTASHQFGDQFQGGGTNELTLADDLELLSLTVTSNSFITNLSIFGDTYTNITENTYISTTNYTLISTNVTFATTNITLLTNTYFSFGDTNYVVNIFPGGGTNSIATETFVTNTIVTLVVGTNLYFVFDPNQFVVAGSTNVSLVDGVTLTNANVAGAVVDDLLINGNWAIMTNGVNGIEWHRDATVLTYPTGDANYSFDQLTLSNRRPTSIIRQLDFTNIVATMFDPNQFNLAPGWTNNGASFTPWTNWMVSLPAGVPLTNVFIYNAIDFEGATLYLNSTSVAVVSSDFYVTDGVSENWNFKTAPDAETVARIGDINTIGYQRMMEEGVNLTQRTNVNFTGLGLTVTDDAGNARTRVDLHTNLNMIAGISSAATNIGFIQFNGPGQTARIREIVSGPGIGISFGNGVSGNPTISQTGDSTIQKVVVEKAGSTVGTRSRLNFIEGGGITLTMTDDGVGNEVDIQIDNTGNLYSFNANQFTASSVTNISIAANPQLTNIFNEGTVLFFTNGVDSGRIWADSGGMVFRAGTHTNIWNRSGTLLATNALIVGGPSYAVGVGGALAVPVRTYTNATAVMTYSNVMAAIDTQHGPVTVVDAPSGGGVYPPNQVCEKVAE